MLKQKITFYVINAGFLMARHIYIFLNVIDNLGNIEKANSSEIYMHIWMLFYEYRPLCFLTALSEMFLSGAQDTDRMTLL